MNHAIELFLFAAVDDQYRPFGTGRFKPSDAILAKIEQFLNSEPYGKVYRECIRDRDTTTEFWAIGLDKTTGNRPGRQFILAVLHDSKVPSNTLEHAIEDMGGIAELASNFDVTVSRSGRPQTWLDYLASNLQLAIEDSNNQSVRAARTNDMADAVRDSNASSNDKWPLSSRPVYQSKSVALPPIVGNIAETNPGTNPLSRTTLQQKDRPSAPKRRISIRPDLNLVLHVVEIAALLWLLLLVNATRINEKHESITMVLHEGIIIVNGQSYGNIQPDDQVMYYNGEVYVNSHLRRRTVTDRQTDNETDQKQDQNPKTGDQQLWNNFR